MQKEIRIIFMGTPDFAVASLKALLDHGYNVVGVITAPDKPAGRGRKLKQSAVKTFALEQGLKVLQPTNLKSEEFIEELKSLNANLQIVVAFRMLPKVVWSMPELGTFNLHASLLPDYRGAAPIHWAIINGETKTGVTTFFIDDKIDTGAIMFQKEVNISEDETVGELHDKLMKIGSSLVIDTVKSIARGDVKSIPQPQGQQHKTAYKLNKENCKIDWQCNLDTIYNKIRGLNPFPSAWCYLENHGSTNTIKIFEVSKTHKEDVKGNIGSIINGGDHLKVVVSDGYLNIHSLQLPGKRKMDVKSLLNGYKFSEEAKMR